MDRLKMTAGQRDVIWERDTCSRPIVACKVSRGTGLDVDKDIKAKLKLVA